MKRQLLSAALGTATLTASCAAAFVPPAPKPFAHSVICITQPASREAITGTSKTNRYSYELLSAWRARDAERTEKPYQELHDLAQKLLSLARSKEVLEEYFHAALVEKYKTVEKMEPWEFDAYAAKSKVNILTVMKSRLLSKRERDKRMGPIEEWHVRSRLLSEFCR